MNQSQSTETVQPANEAAPEKSWLDLGVHAFVKAAVISGLIWWIFREEINGIVRQWLTNPSWSHGFLIPLFSLYFLNQSKDEILAICRWCFSSWSCTRLMWLCLSLCTASP
ncbi:MAG: hypothetical protein ACYTE0_11275 [Planctomycetota bacterium]|jgi:hypothetical protein